MAEQCWSVLQDNILKQCAVVCVYLQITMRIITHNMLKCNVRGVENGYPLIIEATKTEVIPCEFSDGNIPSSFAIFQS
jgi:Fe-S-cluster-containing hydrogenase component 2